MGYGGERKELVEAIIRKSVSSAKPKTVRSRRFKVKRKPNLPVFALQFQPNYGVQDLNQIRELLHPQLFDLRGPVMGVYLLEYPRIRDR